jgi:hypothetical protein
MLNLCQLSEQAESERLVQFYFCPRAVKNTVRYAARLKFKAQLADLRRKMVQAYFWSLFDSSFALFYFKAVVLL